MTSNQIATINHILTVELNCDHYHEDKDEIVATWKKENRPVYDSFNELRDKVRRWKGATFIRNTEEEEYEVTIDKVAAVL